MILFSVKPRKFFASKLPPLKMGTMIPSPQLSGKMPESNSLLYRDSKKGEIISNEFLKTSEIRLSVPELFEFFCSKTAVLISVSVKGESKS